MADRGLPNSRMKDFFDVWFLSQNFAFDGSTLATAIRATFERREMALPIGLPVALTASFYEDDTKRLQWRAFCKRSAITNRTLEHVVTMIAPFLGPALAAAGAPAEFRMSWTPPAGPWAEVRA
jgi:hypothetical protein